MSLHKLALVLNASYEPINVVPARRAIGMVIRGKACVEVASSYEIRTARGRVVVPGVVRLLVYRHVPRLNRAVSRRSILLRDGNACQYCGDTFAPRFLTLDHVVPRSRGGVSSWENLVVACGPCNNKKADRSPAEAGMVLRRKPAPVGIHSRHRLLIGGDAVWDKYLFC